MAFIGTLIGITVIGAVLLVIAIPLLLIWAMAEVLGGIVQGDRRRTRYDPAAEALRYRNARGEIGQAEFEAGMHSLGYVKRR